MTLATYSRDAGIFPVWHIYTYIYHKKSTKWIRLGKYTVLYTWILWVIVFFSSQDFFLFKDQDGTLTPEMQRALDTAFDRCTGQGVFWHVLMLLHDISTKHIGILFFVGGCNNVTCRIHKQQIQNKNVHATLEFKLVSSFIELYRWCQQRRPRHFWWKSIVSWAVEVNFALFPGFFFWNWKTTPQKSNKISDEAGWART